MLLPLRKLDSPFYGLADGNYYKYSEMQVQRQMKKINLKYIDLFVF